MKFIPETVSRKAARALLKTKKNSPHILFGLGLASVVGGTVLACRATLKLEETLDDIKEELDTVKGHALQAKNNKALSYDESDYRKDVGHIALKGGVKLAKMYGPSVVLGIAGISMLTGSHVQMTRRNAALSSTLALVTTAFDDYRKRVREEFGEQKEHDIYHGIVEKIEEVDGKKVKVKTVDPNAGSPYRRIFDAHNLNWQKNAEHNRTWLKYHQSWANQRLRAQGHIFLNEVYDALGLDRSAAGNVVGWVWQGDGDNYVDFGIFQDDNDPAWRDNEPTIWLDFNVDGPILDILEDF